MAEVLQDLNSRGQNRKWGMKKNESRKYANRLFGISDDSILPDEAEDYEKKGYQVYNCGQVLEFGFTHDHRKVLINARFCKDRFCALCQWRRTLKMSYQITRTIEQSMIDNPASRFLFLTLTIKSCSGPDLKNTVTELNKGILKLFRYKAVSKNLIGYVKAIEVTVKRSNEKYHPHAHMLIQVKSTYFKNSSNYLSHLDWQKLWSKAMNLDYNPMVNIKVIRSRNGRDSVNSSVSEVSKYQTKSSSFLSNDNEQDKRIIKTLRTQLRGSRMLSYNGHLKDVHNKLFKQKDEDELIKIDDDSNEKLDKDAGTIVAEFNDQFHNYFIIGHNKTINHE